MNDNDVLIKVTTGISDRYVKIHLSEEIFLDEQSEAIGGAVIDAWKTIVKLAKQTKD